MHKAKDISDWLEETQMRGTKEKCDVIEPENKQKFMFKILPIEGTGEIWAEKIATEIGKIINIDVQDCEFAKKGENIGILITYSLNTYEHEILVEGSSLITEIISDFDIMKYENYKFNIIKESLEKKNASLLNSFLDLLFFDAIIGNTDRHCENWGIIRNPKTEEIKLCAAYDNSSSLGRDLFSKNKDFDKIDLKAYANKSKSSIRCCEGKKRSHYWFVHYIIKEYPYKVNDFKIKIEQLTKEKIDIIFRKIPTEFMRNECKEIIKEFLMIRIKTIKEILTMGNVIEVTWKDPNNNRKRTKIGELEKLGNTYIFEYTDEAKNGLDNEFSYFGEFKNLSERYESPKLFNSFKTRAPANRKRKDIIKYFLLNDLEIDCDDFDVLKCTRGVLSTDTIELFEKIDFNQNEIKTFLVGTRYYLNDSISLTKETPIEVIEEPENEHDKYAVYVKNIKSEENNMEIKLGYIPRHYAKEFKEWINNKDNYNVKIERLIWLNDDRIADILISLKRD